VESIPHSPVVVAQFHSVRQSSTVYTSLASAHENHPPSIAHEELATVHAVPSFTDHIHVLTYHRFTPDVLSTYLRRLHPALCTHSTRIFHSILRFFYNSIPALPSGLGIYISSLSGLVKTAIGRSNIKTGGIPRRESSIIFESGDRQARDPSAFLNWKLRRNTAAESAAGNSVPCHPPLLLNRLCVNFLLSSGPLFVVYTVLMPYQQGVSLRQPFIKVFAGSW